MARSSKLATMISFSPYQFLAAKIITYEKGTCFWHFAGIRSGNMFFFRMATRLAWLMLLLFGGTAAVIVGVVVIATDGFGSANLVDLPGQRSIAPSGEVETVVPPGKLNEVVERREVFATVPLPSQVSTEPPVIATNLGITALLAILFGLISTMLNNLLREKEDRLEAWLSVFYLDRLWRLFRFGTHRGIQRGCLTMPVIILVFALYGIIFAYVEEGLNIFKPEDLQLAIVLAITVTLVSLSGDVAQRQVARFWRKTSTFGIYPANLILALVTTFFTRLFSLVPGILFGSPGGMDVEGMDDEPQFRHVVLAIVTLMVMLGLGIFGWGTVAALDSVGDNQINGASLEFTAPLFALAQTMGFALFVLALETAFFEMAPLGLTMGSRLFRWNVLVWLVFFGAACFGFLHVLWNPRSEYLDAFEQAEVSILVAVIVILTIITAAAWFFLTYVEPPNRPQPPGGGGGYQHPQQPYYPPPPPPRPPDYNPPPPSRR
jgi:hypothetical protein